MADGMSSGSRGRGRRSKKDEVKAEETLSIKEAIKLMMEERNLTREVVHKLIEDSIRASYKSKFKTDENCYVEIAEDDSEVNLYMIKTIVPDDDLHDGLMEMTLSEARKIGSDAEVGDEVLQALDIKTLERTSITSGKQKFKQSSKEFQKNKLYNEFKSKEKEIIVGYVQNVDYKTGDCYVDLGNGNSGILPRMYQSPIETYKKDDKVYCYVEEVKVRDRGVDIILSRTSGQLVRKFLELNVPEIADGTIQIYKVVRKAGYKSKVAVFTESKMIDPVGTCVGLQGSRIQNIVRELHGEKIDIIEYTDLIEQFVANSLTPAVIKMVRVMDYDTRKVYAVCEEKELSYAIGKAGLNVQLANKLTDWLIEIKSEKQYKDLNLDSSIRIEADELFADNGFDLNEYSDENNARPSDEDASVRNESESAEAESDGSLDESDKELAGDAQSQGMVESAASSDAGSESNQDEVEDEGDLLFSDLPFSDAVKAKIAAKGIESVLQFADLGVVDAMEFFQFTTEEYGEFVNILGEYVELVDES